MRIVVARNTGHPNKVEFAKHFGVSRVALNAALNHAAIVDPPGGAGSGSERNE